MVDKLVIHPIWTTSPQIGCCGIGAISRLKSTACTPSARDANIQAWLDLKHPNALMSDLPGWYSKTMKQMLQYLDLRPQGVQWLGRETSTRWNGGAVTTEEAFCAVLEDSMLNSKYAIYFMSDNIDGTGDVHNGPFSTRNFASWLRQESLGSLTDTGPVTSLRTQRNIQGWMFVPNWDIINKRVAFVKDQLVGRIKEINSDPKIKKAEEERCKQQSIKSKALRTSLGTSWGSYTYENSIIGAAPARGGAI